MGAHLHVIGLGPAGMDKLTLESYHKLLQAEKVYVRTLEHPCVRELMREGVRFQPFDDAYNGEETFERVYEEIAGRLEEELKSGQDVVYAVPGHPYVAEKTVRLLRARLPEGVEMTAYAAVSFLDELFSVLGLDPSEGMLIRDYDNLRNSGITGREWLIVPQVFSSLIASDVKLDLMQFYSDETMAYVVKGLGTEGQQVLNIPLFELDHQDFDHLTTVVLPPVDNAVSWAKLLEVMARLRSPEGCPWDQEQNHASLKPYLIEESYEVLEAIEAQDMYNLCEELGDLLLQVVFHAQVATEEGNFTAQDVLRAIIEKMIRRHPHVFGSGKARTSGEVIQAWEKIKQTEKAGMNKKPEYFSSPRGLPALMLAAASQQKAAKVGFDWPNWLGPWEKIREEIGELKEAIAKGEGVAEELGDLLFAAVNFARFWQIDAEQALRDSVHKFQSRFLKMRELAGAEGHDLADLSLEEMDIYWEKAKTHEKSGKVVLV